MAAILEEYWTMATLSTIMCLMVCFALKPASSLQTIREDRHSWLQDAQFLESFSELRRELNSEDSRELMKSYHQQEADVTHFCFLVHGYSGFSQTVMNLMVDREKHILAGSPEATIRHDMVVRVPSCNELKTKDGVERGGQRLVEEMLETIRIEMKKRVDSCNDGAATVGIRDITISMLGNSLGGLYSRFAIAELVERADNMVLDGQYRLHLNVFCTTASPHLGISKHTYVPIPRSAEIGVAHTMGNTGKDLFRLNDLLKTMATTPKYLHPLGSFRKRIAYANAYGTDFPVPTATAAFLHPASTYPHHVGQDGEDCVVVDDNGLVVAVFHTPRLTPDSNESEEHADDLAHMSHSLDSLGWKKVFVDLRGEITIGVNVPRPLRPTMKSSLQGKRIVGSRDVVEATTLPPDLNRISWPCGHNMIVAFSRSSKSASFNKGGRPVVDALANELVGFIFTWQPPGEKSS